MPNEYTIYLMKRTPVARLFKKPKWQMFAQLSPQTTVTAQGTTVQGAWAALCLLLSFEETDCPFDEDGIPRTKVDTK